MGQETRKPVALLMMVGSLEILFFISCGGIQEWGTRSGLQTRAFGSTEEAITTDHPEFPPEPVIDKDSECS